MKKNLLLTTVLVAFLITSGNTQGVFDFEELTVPTETGYWNGSNLSGSFGNYQIMFNNNYNSDYASWSGFSYAWDTITVDNQYINSAVEANSGNIFGIGYVPSDWESGTYDNIPIVCSFGVPTVASSIFVANSEYAADAIINGIWGIPGFTDGDYFKIIIEGKNSGESKGFVEYYLADYRDGANFVLASWEEINLSSFGVIDTLKFNLESSDTGDYGMNTPAYFCIDDLAYTLYNSVEEINTKLNVYPNPATDFITINNSSNSKIEIIDISGKIVLSNVNCNKHTQINISEIKSGIYFIKIYEENNISALKFIKQ